jgi:hypothetical protein
MKVKISVPTYDCQSEVPRQVKKGPLNRPVRAGSVARGLFFSVLYVAGICAAESPSGIFQGYGANPPEETAALVRNELGSKDPLRRDNAVLFLAILINAGKGDRERGILLDLAGEREAVAAASDIIEERLAGWYEERGEARERSMPMYYPLFHLLSLSQSKLAGSTLLQALPAAGFDPFFRKSFFSNGNIAKIALSRLSALESRLCCFFPGKELVSDMQAIDFRLNMLAMYLEAAQSGRQDFKSSPEMKEFVSQCLAFGDRNMGRVIRTRAVELACMCARAGIDDFLPAVRKIAASDPCLLYRSVPGEGNCVPRYDGGKTYYPVREKAAEELSHLAGR